MGHNAPKRTWVSDQPAYEPVLLNDWLIGTQAMPGHSKEYQQDVNGNKCGLQVNNSTDRRGMRSLQAQIDRWRPPSAQCNTYMLPGKVKADKHKLQQYNNEKLLFRIASNRKCGHQKGLRLFFSILLWIERRTRSRTGNSSKSNTRAVSMLRITLLHRCTVPSCSDQREHTF